MTVSATSSETATLTETATFTASSTATSSLTPTPAQPYYLLYNQDFSAYRENDYDFVYRVGHRVVLEGDAAYRLYDAAQPLVFMIRPPLDTRVQAEVTFSSGAMLLGARQSEAQGYALQLDSSGGVELLRNGMVVASSSVLLSGQTHVMGLTIDGSTLTGAINYVTVLTFTDAAPLFDGDMTLSGINTPPDDVLIDDVQIWGTQAPQTGYSASRSGGLTAPGLWIGNPILYPPLLTLPSQALAVERYGGEFNIEVRAVNNSAQERGLRYTYYNQNGQVGGDIRYSGGEISPSGGWAVGLCDTPDAVSFLYYIYWCFNRLTGSKAGGDISSFNYSSSNVDSIIWNADGTGIYFHGRNIMCCQPGWRTNWDLWAADFNISTGQLSNIRMVAETACREYAVIDNTYLVNSCGYLQIVDLTVAGGRVLTLSTALPVVRANGIAVDANTLQITYQNPNCRLVQSATPTTCALAIVELTRTDNTFTVNDTQWFAPAANGIAYLEPQLFMGVNNPYIAVIEQAQNGTTCGHRLIAIDKNTAIRTSLTEIVIWPCTGIRLSKAEKIATIPLEWQQAPATNTPRPSATPSRIPRTVETQAVPFHTRSAQFGLPAPFTLWPVTEISDFENGFGPNWFSEYRSCHLTPVPRGSIPPTPTPTPTYEPCTFFYRGTNSIHPGVDYYTLPRCTVPS